VTYFPHRNFTHVRGTLRFINVQVMKKDALSLWQGFTQPDTQDTYTNGR